MSATTKPRQSVGLCHSCGTADALPGERFCDFCLPPKSDYAMTKPDTTRPKRAKIGALNLSLVAPDAPPLVDAPSAAPIALFDLAPEEGHLRRIPSGELKIWKENPRQWRDPQEVADLAQSVAKSQDEDLKAFPERDKDGNPTGKYLIFDGGSRFEGRHHNGREVWRVRVLDISEDEALDRAARSQFERNDWRPLDRAHWYASKRRRMPKGDATSVREMQERLEEGGKKSHNYQTIQNHLALLELPLTVQEAFYAANVTEAHGREVLKLQGYPADQLALIEWAKENGKDKDGKRELATVALTAKETTRVLEELGITPKVSTKAKKAAKDAQSPSLPFGEVSTQVDSDGAATGQPKGNPDDAELPKEDSWRSDLTAQHAGENGVSSTAPASSGSGFATAPEAGSTINAAPGQTGTRAIQVGRVVSEEEGPRLAVAAMSELFEQFATVIDYIKTAPELTPEESKELIDKGYAMRGAVQDFFVQIRPYGLSKVDTGTDLWDASGSLRSALASLKRYEGPGWLSGGETYIFDFLKRDAKALPAEVKRVEAILQQKQAEKEANTQ